MKSKSQPTTDDGLMNSSGEPEHFVDAERIGQLLNVSHRYVLQLARDGAIPSHPLSDRGRRKVWRFRLSEVAAAVERKK